MMRYSLILMVAVLVAGLLLAGHVPATAQTVTSDNPTTVYMVGGTGIDMAVYTGGSDAVVYTPVSQFSGWLHRMTHNKGTHHDKNAAWIAAGFLWYRL